MHPGVLWIQSDYYWAFLHRPLGTKHWKKYLQCSHLAKSTGVPPVPDVYLFHSCHKLLIVGWYNCGSLSVTNTARHLTSATQHAGGGHHFVTLWASQFQRWFYEKLVSTDDWDLSNVGSRGAAMETNLVYYSALCTSLCGEQSISLSSQHPQFTAPYIKKFHERKFFIFLIYSK